MDANFADGHILGARDAHRFAEIADGRGMHAPLMEYPAQSIRRAGAVGQSGLGLLGELERTVQVPPLLGHHIGEVVLGLGQVRILLQGEFVLLARLARLPRHFVEHTQEMANGGVVGLLLAGLNILFKGHIDLTRGGVEPRELVVGLHPSGLQLQGFLERAPRPFEIARSKRRQARNMPEVRRVRIRFQSLVDRLDALFNLPLSIMDRQQ